MTKTVRNLLIAATLCWSSSALAFTPGGTCDGWSTWGTFGTAAYSVSVAELQELQSDGSWLTVEVSEDRQFNDATTGEFTLGALWDLTADGTYRVVLDTTLYALPGAEEPTDAELASWDPGLIFYYGPDVSEQFVCDAPPPPAVDARTPGYWKNHPEAWGSDVLGLGGVEYDQACLLAVLDLPTRGDLRVKLLHHLIAAKLNLLAGSDPAPISATVADADAYVAGMSVDCGSAELSGSKPKGDEKDLVEALKTTLDLYNNNVL